MKRKRQCGVALPADAGANERFRISDSGFRGRGIAEAGITLLEMLVSITIVSLLATTALFAWRAGVSGWEKASALLEGDRTVLAVHQLVSEQIASMTPYQAPLQQGGRVMFFQGEAETARFVSRYSLTHRGASGLYLAEYHVAEQQDGTRQLLFREEPVWRGAELGAKIAGRETESGVMRTRFLPFEGGATAVVLLERLAECRFEYYRPATAGRPGAWTDEWTGGGNEMPSAMRIHALAREDAGNLKPVTIAATVWNYAQRRAREE